ncbi:PD-(D/E)XK nuclease family protein [Robiginitalea sp. M366]|uniref:PD-(D/E)XK nuclease family protein n=1 Tax=Robiginitalea aestuariiviva TaxID=3036903 RepID=UPI00240CF10C|nr:PD-(D/E)XK nuclease family protein [Robiginitalea aestuariiviva]MDG1571598.1 PD-(D/E)XK nuclease family protein [Robiginitalea aestuariiviva]
MQTFLDQVLDQLPDWKTRPEELVLVLPSKRAGYFLKNRMAKKAGKTMLMPQVWSIEDFVSHLADQRYSPRLQSLFCLYEAYLETDSGLEKESFSDFAKWAPTLLQDFNEIDRYLVDAPSLFKYLAALKEIRHWMPDGETTDMIERRIAFWKILLPLYQKLRNSLRAQGMGYQGQVYRTAVEAYPQYLANHPDKTFVFIGFNALNTAEKTLIQGFLQAGRAQIFWDADTHYVQHPVHDAGLFLRKYLREWSILRGTLQGTGNHLNSQKNIQVVGLPKTIAQARYVGQIVKDLHAKLPERLDQCAIVLGDESHLDPMLHSLPGTISAVNITMGYPLRHSPLAQVFGLRFTAAQDYHMAGWGVHHILELLENPLLQPWFRKLGITPHKIRSRIIAENPSRLDKAKLEALGLPRLVVELLLSTASTSPRDHLRKTLNLILELKTVYQHATDKIILEQLRHFYRLFTPMADLCEKYPYIASISALELLFDQLLAEEQLDFQGEPLEGLQLMGMLESRNLDFETVILTAVNEGVLPAGKSHNSFIPYEVKKDFGLPTFKEKDAIYAYHFYRLLQRAKNIYLLYNTEADALEGGEPSRFIQQLRSDPVLSPYIKERTAIPEFSHEPPRPFSIRKEPALLERLAEIASSGFSPTALSRFIKDPMEFYQRQVLRLPESESLEETVAANTFGTVLHQALEDLYRPLTGQVLTAGVLEHMRSQVPEILGKAYSAHYLHGQRASGKNLIALKVMEQHLQMFLDQESREVKRHEVRILGVEQPLKASITVPGLNIPIYLKGTLDRIESIDGEVRIIDYKTGRVEPANLRIDSWEDACTGPERNKAFQLLCYAWLYQQSAPEASFRAGIVSFRNLNQGRQWFGLRKEKSRDETLNPAMTGAFAIPLQALIGRIFDSQIPFMAPQELLTSDPDV